MRRNGASIRDVERKLGIPRSTLSGWFRDIYISPRHQNVLEKRGKKSLAKARLEAAKWHNQQKRERLKLAERSAQESLATIDTQQNEIIELALAMLYLGEGAKTKSRTAMGNSDPMILKFFVRAIQKLYDLSPEDFRCHLHLRYDQNPEKLKRYWSRTLKIPLCNFRKPIIDKRTSGSPTYPHYRGVCAVDCSHVAIQRKLMYISTAFCEQIAEKRA